MGRSLPNGPKMLCGATYDMFDGLLHLKVVLQSMPATSGCPVLNELDVWSGGFWKWGQKYLDL